VNVNYTVFRDVVNALGGTITVTINSRDPQGQMDSNFDWKCGASYSTRLKNCPPDGHYIQYTNGQHVIDAEHALYLAQARGDTAPTYGFEQSNFDREKNQQMIIKAVRDKAASVGLFTDVSKINTVISSLGDNLRTTFAANEVKTLVSLAQNIKDSNINSISLIDGTTPIMTTGSINGQSSVFPAAGTYDYSALQAYIKKSLSSDPVTREGAPVAVYNGSGVAGLAQTEANTLTSDGFTVSTIASTPAAGYAKYELYQVGTGNSATKAKLEKLLGVTTKTTALPISVSSTAKFVVIIGTQPTTTTH
jgi:anionic cell wall polymer biosynthesis LytR-Cps2A-Psr (LCP) family protein